MSLKKIILISILIVVILYIELYFVRFREFSTSSKSDFIFTLVSMPALVAFLNITLLYLFFYLKNKSLYLNSFKVVILSCAFLFSFLLPIVISQTYKYLIYQIPMPSEIGTTGYGLFVHHGSEEIGPGTPREYLEIKWDEHLPYEKRAENVSKAIAFYEKLSLKENARLEGVDYSSGIIKPNLINCRELFEKNHKTAHKISGIYLSFGCNYTVNKVIPIQYGILFGEYSVRIPF